MSLLTQSLMDINLYIQTSEVRKFNLIEMVENKVWYELILN